MPTIRALIALFACAAVGLGAETTKLRTLAGKKIEGDLVSLSEKEIVVQTKDGPVTAPLPAVLDLDIQPALAPADAKFTDVQLTDGTLLHCLQFGLKGKQVEVKLVKGAEVKLPLETVSSVLTNAQDPKVREEWQGLQAKRGNQDLLAIKDSEGTVNGLEGTFGEGDDGGATIGFETAAGQNRRVSLSRIHAMSFLRKLNPDAPSAVCRVYDTSRNVFAALKVSLGDAGFTITTAAGVKVDLPRNLVARIDYSQGKLTYLSDLDPIKVTEKSMGDARDQWVEHYRRDKNMDGGPLRLLREDETIKKPVADMFPKGLALHAYAELLYDLNGQYKELKTVLGVDPTVGGDSHVKITIEGDGRELLAAEVKRKDLARPVTLDVKNVKQLRIVVAAVGILDLGGHLNLADAKVSK